MQHKNVNLNIFYLQSSLTFSHLLDNIIILIGLFLT